MTLHNHDTENTLLASLLGAGFSIVTHPVSEAFLYGFVGAIGGLTCKLIYGYFLKKYESKQKRRKS